MSSLRDHLSRQSNWSLSHNASCLGSLDIAGIALPPERFVEGVTDPMVCLVCTKVSPDPVYLLCCYNKYYCYKCIGEGEGPTILCPSCNVPTNAKTLTRNDNLRNMIYALKTVSCEYAGCAVLSTLDTIQDHTESCVYQPISCENSGCSVTCLLKDWVWHCKVKCGKRKTRCVGSCHALITSDDVETHDCDNVLRSLVKYQHDEIEVLSKLFQDQHEEHLHGLLHRTRGELRTPVRVASSEDVDADLERRISKRLHVQEENDAQLAQRISERLLLRQANENNLSEMVAIRDRCKGVSQDYKLKILNEDDEMHDQLGHVLHHGSWRCSVLTCALPHAQHDYTHAFSDGARHIFFWDCCLNDSRDSTSCDVFECEEDEAGSLDDQFRIESCDVFQGYGDALVAADNFNLYEEGYYTG